MTAVKPRPKRKAPTFPKFDYAPTKLPGGVAKLVQIWDDLRTRNTDGYLPAVGGILANLKNHGSLAVCKGTTCTPFSATVIGVAFDPGYPRNDWPNWENETTMPAKAGGDAYVPMVNGGKEPMPSYAVFHVWHNTNNQAVASVVGYNLGVAIEPTEMRRGDLVAIDWWSGGGHGVFCWDVHLDANGKVDCFQIVGSNGPTPGVSIYGCRGKPWLDGKNATGKRGTGSYKKLRDKIFVDDDEVVKAGVWFGVPGVTKVDLSTFRVRPKAVTYSKSSNPYSVRRVECARFHYDGAPPKPFSMKDGAAAPPAVGHVSAPTTTVTGQGVRSNPDVLHTTAPKKVEQEKDKPTQWQLEVEQAMQVFFKANWIQTDPGTPDGINDAKTQAAVKDFQGKFKLDVDGIAGSETRKALRRERPACQRQREVEEQLGRLFRGKKLKADPGPVDGVNGADTKAAVQEFQKLVELDPTGIPDAATQAKLNEYLAQQTATTTTAGVEPGLGHLYWVGNHAEPGGKAKLRLTFKDLILGQRVPVHLEDEVSGTKVADAAAFTVENTTVDLEVAIPAQFGPGARVRATIQAAIADEGEMESYTGAPLLVRGSATTEPVDWRPYIGKDAVPAALLDAIRRNRARYPMKKFTAARGGPNNVYAGPHKWDYKPPAAHTKWAKEHFQKKVDAATQATRNAARAFMLMLGAEGRPASMQTYDNQIVTWGVGLGAKGDGVHAFTHLNKDAAMQRLLDDLGINYFGHDYHVVDLRSGKVVSSAAGRKGNDNRHIQALEAWRQQLDLLSAIIGISEDPATREAVAESQYAVYLSNSASWPGQDKVFTLALYFMIAHMYHWMPAIAKYGFNVETEFQALGGGAPSMDKDRQLAVRVARAFVAKAKTFFVKRPGAYDDIRTRTKTRLWKKLREDGKAEGFDPGELTYAD